jgi:thymidylate synthase (FAD)
MKVELIAATPNAEKVIESAGRTCYLSFDKATDKPIVRGEKDGKTKLFRAEDIPGLASLREGDLFRTEAGDWKAVRIWRHSAEKFIEMLLKSGHHSVLEHATATFRIQGASRACTHQMVRHRLTSVSQQSQRYVNEEDFAYIEPPAVQANPEAHELFVDFLEKARETYQRLQEIGIENEDARFVLPNAVESEIVVSANFREWRHILLLRGSRGAQWEIAGVMADILKNLKNSAPSVFCDLEWNSKNGQIRVLDLSGQPAR